MRSLTVTMNVSLDGVLGEGVRLFEEGAPLTTFTLTDCVTTTKGVLVVRYHRN